MIKVGPCANELKLAAPEFPEQTARELLEEESKERSTAIPPSAEGTPVVLSSVARQR